MGILKGLVWFTANFLAANGSFGTAFTIRCQIFGHPRVEDSSAKKLAGQRWQGTHRRKPNVP
jgi:hypothetical protein